MLRMWWAARTALVATVVLAAAGCAAAPETSPGSAARPAPEPAATITAAPPPAPWVGTWAVAVQPGGQRFQQQTLRQIVHTSIGGGSARVRLSHAYGQNPLTVGAVRVARQLRGSAVDPATDRAVTFDGITSVTIPPGGSVLSDEIDFAVPAGGNVAISAFLPAPTGPTTRHGSGTQHNYIAAGDQTTAPALSGARTTTSYFVLAGLDVRNAEATGAVVAFGASITDGVASTVSANLRWPDLLAGRLRASGRTIGVLNAGISGNQYTADRFGERAAKRFERDVLQQPGVRWVIISDNAINDFGNSGAPAPVVIEAFEALVDRAHEVGIRVICSTLTPFRGAGYWTRAGEDGRTAFNAFVRGPESGCDAVLDLDAATRDPAQPSRYLRAYDSGDHLHPGNRGMRAIADAVDLSWF